MLRNSLVLFVVLGLCPVTADADCFGFKKIGKRLRKGVSSVGDGIQSGADKIGQAARDARRSKPVQTATGAVEKATKKVVAVAKDGAKAAKRGAESAAKRISFGFKRKRCAPRASSAPKVTPAVAPASTPCPAPPKPACCPC